MVFYSGTRTFSSHPVQWGSHTPSTSADARTCFHCLLLDFVDSQNFSRDKSRPAPYLVRGLGLLHTNEWRFYYIPLQSEAKIPTIISHYRLDPISSVHQLCFRLKTTEEIGPLRTTYTLSVVAEALDDFGEFAYVMQDGAALQLTTSFAIEWEVDGAPAATVRLGWKEFTAIMRDLGRGYFDKNGAPFPEHIRDGNVRQIPFFKHAGFAGVKFF